MPWQGGLGWPRCGLQAGFAGKRLSATGEEVVPLPPEHVLSANAARTCGTLNVDQAASYWEPKLVLGVTGNACCYLRHLLLLTVGFPFSTLAQDGKLGPFWRRGCPGQQHHRLVSTGSKPSQNVTSLDATSRQELCGQAIIGTGTTRAKESGNITLQRMCALFTTWSGSTGAFSRH